MDLMCKYKPFLFHYLKAFGHIEMYSSSFQNKKFQNQKLKIDKSTNLFVDFFFFFNSSTSL